jgi:hypothetical protein
MNLALTGALSSTLLFALFTAPSPSAAQVATSNGQQQLFTSSGQSQRSQGPTSGVICMEEMTATFCNVVTGPNNTGYGSSGGSASSGATGSGGGASASTSSIPPCSTFPPANELCN